MTARSVSDRAGIWMVGRRATLDVLHVAKLVVVIGLVAASADHMTIENKFLLGPNLQLFANFNDP